MAQGTPDDPKPARRAARERAASLERCLERAFFPHRYPWGTHRDVLTFQIPAIY